MSENTNEMFRDTYRYNSVAVAFYIVAWANEHHVTINLTKTQKLLYVAYGANLVIGKDRLCSEHPEAWPYGPVFPSTRDALLGKNLADIKMDSKEVGRIKDDKYLNQLITFVFAGFGNYNAGQLTKWSHSPSSPWDKTTHLDGFKWGKIIPDVFIAEYFRRHIKTTPADGKK